MNAISKKLLSFVIVLAMVLSMAPVITLPAAAATDTQTAINEWIATWGETFSAATGNLEAPCPVCSPNTNVPWTRIASGSSPAANEHAFLAANHASHTNMNFWNGTADGDHRCLYLNGANTTISGRMRISKAATMNVFGSGSITRRHTDKGAGTSSDYTKISMFDITGAATVNVYGGTFTSAQQVHTTADGVVTNEGGTPLVKVTNAATVNFYGSTLAVASGTGANVIQSTGSSNITLNGCTVTGNGTDAAIDMQAGTLKLSGVTSIAAPGLTLGTDVYADVTNLAAGSTIAVNGVKGQKIAVNGDAAKAAMFTAPTGLAVNVSGTDLVLGDPVVEELPEWDSDIPTRIDQWLDVYADDFTAASAAETKKSVETAICPICGAENVSWTYRYSNNALNADGAAAHYYLYSDVVRNTFDTVGANQEYPVCVYLNNKTYSTTGVFQVKNTLNIFDDPDVLGGQVLGADGTTKGGNYVAMPLFRLTAATSDLNLYYGEYIGAQPHVADLNDSGTALIGASANSGQAYIYGATLQNTHYGEVLRATYNVTVELENCELKGGSGYVDGEGVTYGGNIYMEKGTVTLKNTTVTGGTATNGSVYVGGGTLKLAGTTSIATNGLTLGADVYADVTDLATTNGAIVMNGVKDQQIATNGDETKATYFTAPEGLEVTVNGTDLVLTEPEVADPGPAYADGDTTIQKINKFTAYYAEKFAAGGNVETTDCPVCGATRVTWRAKSSGSLTAQTVDEVQVATHYYLAASWERSGSQEQLGASHSAPICVYLNGNTFKTEGRLLVKDQLNIFDNASNAGGIIKPTHDQGSESYTKVALFDVYSGELNIYGGQYDSQQANVIAGQNINGTPLIESHHSDSVVNIYGGTFKNTGVGTVIDLSNGAVTMTGGTLQGGNGYVETTTVEEVTTATGNTLGGNVYVTGGTFTLNGGTIQNGVANAGGNVYVAADGTLAMNNGTITGGKANDTDSDTDGGGNVYNGGTFTMTDGLITLGEATNDGGNVLNRRATGKACTLSGGSITGGKATNGGNLFGRLATTLSGVTISGGNATNGGNLYTINSRITMSAGSVTGGKATNGGNVYVARGASGAPGQLRLSGGTVSGGVATGNGGNVYITDNSYSSLDLRGGTISDGEAAIGGNVYVTGAGTLEMTSGNITGGVAPDAKGSCVYASGKAELSGGTIHGTNDVTDSALLVTGANSRVNLSGDVDITADNGKAIRVISSGTMNIEPTWTGTAYAMIYALAGWDMGEVIGRTVEGEFAPDFVQCGTYDAEGNWTACGEGNYFPGSLYQYTNNGSKLFALADGSLQAAGGAFVKGEEITWCRDSAATIDEATKEGVVYDYMWLTGDVTMNGETITVDASGSKDVTLFGTGYVNGIDLANTDYKTNSDGLAVDPLSTETIKVNGEYTFGVNRYIALQQGAWTFHCLDLKLSAITLRPNKDNDNGLYYKSTIVCDKALAEEVDAYGVVLSKQNMPEADFTTDYFEGTGAYENSWTVVTKDLPIVDDKVSATVNSALVKGILKVTNENAKNVINGEKTIFANAYLQIDANGDGDPEYFMATNRTARSLFDVLSAIDSHWTKYEANHGAIGEFYGFWATNHGLNAWNSSLVNIAAQAATLQN